MICKLEQGFERCLKEAEDHCSYIADPDARAAAEEAEFIRRIEEIDDSSTWEEVWLVVKYSIASAWWTIVLWFEEK
tara:strand:- start:73 stop:300 length:228 start_codon:yes stop_codon:yes gene_type:complete